MKINILKILFILNATMLKIEKSYFKCKNKWKN